MAETVKKTYSMSRMYSTTMGKLRAVAGIVSLRRGKRYSITECIDDLVTREYVRLTRKESKK